MPTTMLTQIDVHVIEDYTALYTALGAVAGVIVGAGAPWLQQRSKIGADGDRRHPRHHRERRRQKAGERVRVGALEERNKELGGVRTLFVEQAVARVGSQTP
jgi:hypothetical protein